MTRLSKLSALAKWPDLRVIFKKQFAMSNRTINPVKV